MHSHRDQSFFEPFRNPLVTSAITVVAAGMGWLAVQLAHRQAAVQASYLFAAFEQTDIADLRIAHDGDNK